MASRLLGDFTPEVVAEPEEDLSFGWFGATIRIGPEFGELVFTDWAEEFAGIDEDDVRGTYVNKILWRRLLHADDFEEFWRLAREHRQSSEDLARLFRRVNKVLTEQATGRPTQLPGDSSPGQKTAMVSSAGISYGPGTAVSAAAERAAAKLEAQGRPDLALVVERAQEALSA